MRPIDWRHSEVDSEQGTIVDAAGYLGPFLAFTLAQMHGDHGPVSEWRLTSHFIPSRARGTTYRSMDDGKRACEKIVAGFADWLSQ